MNRRGFIAGMLVACVAPHLLLGGQPRRWKRTEWLWEPGLGNTIRYVRLPNYRIEEHLMVLPNFANWIALQSRLPGWGNTIAFPVIKHS